MKKTILTILLFSVSVVTLISCNSKNDDDLFYDTYKEILIIREQDADTSTANKAVRQLIKDRGYSEQSFKDEFIRLSQEPNAFAKKIDSLRQVVNDMK